MSIFPFFVKSCTQHAVGVRQPKQKVPWYLSFFLLPYWSDTSESVKKNIHQRSSRGAIVKKLYLPYKTKPESRGEITKGNTFERMRNSDFRENGDFHGFSLSQCNEGTYVKPNHNFFLKVGMGKKIY